MADETVVQEPPAEAPPEEGLDFGALLELFGGASEMSEEEKELIRVSTEIMRTNLEQLQRQNQLMAGLFPQHQQLFSMQTQLALAQAQASMRLLPVQEQTYRDVLDEFEGYSNNRQANEADIRSAYQTYLNRQPTAEELGRYLTPPKSDRPGDPAPTPGAPVQQPVPPTGTGGASRDPITGLPTSGASRIPQEPFMGAGRTGQTQPFPAVTPGDWQQELRVRLQNGLSNPALTQYYGTALQQAGMPLTVAQVQEFLAKGTVNGQAPPPALQQQVLSILRTAAPGAPGGPPPVQGQTGTAPPPPTGTPTGGAAGRAITEGPASLGGAQGNALSPQQIAAMGMMTGVYNPSLALTPEQRAAGLAAGGGAQTDINASRPNPGEGPSPQTGTSFADLIASLQAQNQAQYGGRTFDLRGEAEYQLRRMLSGEAPSLSTQQQAAFDTIYSNASRRADEDTRRFAEELAANRGLNLTDTPAAQVSVEERRKLAENMAAQRAQGELTYGQANREFTAGIAGQQQTFDQAIKQFQEGLRMQALQNRAAIASGLGPQSGNLNLPSGGQGDIGGASALLNSLAGQRQAGASQAASLYGQLLGQQFQAQQNSLNRQNQFNIAGMNQPNTNPGALGYLAAFAPLIGAGIGLINR